MKPATLPPPRSTAWRWRKSWRRSARAARIIKEIAWRWREIGADSRICDLIDSQVGAIEERLRARSPRSIPARNCAAFDVIERAARGVRATAMPHPDRRTPPLRQPVGSRPRRPQRMKCSPLVDAELETTAAALLKSEAAVELRSLADEGRTAKAEAVMADHGGA